MPTLDDLVRDHTDLDDAAVAWLHELTADWQLLADLSFADLVLWVPVRDGSGYVAVAQMRPTTGPTALYDDVVGQHVPYGRRRPMDAAVAQRRICRERDLEWYDELAVREEAIPVVCGQDVIAVIARHTNLGTARTPSRLELSYLQCADDLSWMIAEGRFPFPGTMLGRRGAPRVGDGLVRLNAAGVVAYASPNAVSAYRRLGLAGDLIGRHFGDTTAELACRGEAVDEPVAVVTGGRVPRRVDVEGRDAVLALRSLPLERDSVRVGALVLVRDVTELRRRERELLSKDATIREIHHRVKNNLQTVAALLRLQARRLDSPEGRAALEEAMRRVASIAMVHDTLSRQLDGIVDLGEIAEQIVTAAVDVAAGAVPVDVRREGTWGEVPAEVATPLAMAVSELVHNAVEHGLVPDGGTVVVSAARSRDRLSVSVADDGRGLPAGFNPAGGSTLGLQIVRTLVEGELGGRLSFRSNQPTGTVAVIEVPISAS